MVASAFSQFLARPVSIVLAMSDNNTNALAVLLRCAGHPVGFRILRKATVLAVELSPLDDGWIDFGFPKLSGVQIAERDATLPLVLGDGKPMQLVRFIDLGVDDVVVSPPVTLLNVGLASFGGVHG
jgi:hypothetical protein